MALSKRFGGKRLLKNLTHTKQAPEPCQDKPLQRAQPTKQRTARVDARAVADAVEAGRHGHLRVDPALQLLISSKHLLQARLQPNVACTGSQSTLISSKHR